MNINIKKYMRLAMAALAVLVSCGPENPVVEVTPEFPAMVENDDVLPGQTLTLSFVPNLDWTVRISDESVKWFSILDGTFETDYVSGKASAEPVEVKIKVSGLEEFDSARVCEVSLTMGEETEVIARYTRQPKDRSIAVYTAVVDDNEFVFGGDDGGYMYNSEEAGSVGLIWPEGTNGFRMLVKVESNFEWVVSLPDWAEAVVPETTVGVHSFEILGVPSAYPLEGAEATMTFKAGDAVVKELPITIPSCKDRFALTLSGGMTAIDFNGEGEYAIELGYRQAPAIGSIYGPKGVGAVVVDKTEDGYAAEESDWVHIRIADWDEAGDVLQTRDVEFTVDVNETGYREAVVIGLPATFTGQLSDLFSGSEIKEEYAENTILITQDIVSDEYVIPLSGTADRESVGLFFENLTSGPVYNWFGQTDYAYKLIYSVAWSIDEGWMYLKTPYHMYKVFDEKRVEQPAEDFWLSVETTEDKHSVRVNMNVDSKAEGYVAFYDIEGNNLGVIRCIYDPDYTPVVGEETRVEFIGESAAYAEMTGAVLEEITEGTLYDAYKEYYAPIYQLTYRTDTFPMRISLPQGTVFYSVNPYMKRDLFRLNNLSYDETGGSFSYIDGGVDIYMSLDPDRPESLVSKGTIIFSRERFNTSDKVTLILICTLDMSGE